MKHDKPHIYQIKNFDGSNTWWRVYFGRGISMDFLCWNNALYAALNNEIAK